MIEFACEATRSWAFVCWKIFFIYLFIYLFIYDCVGSLSFRVRAFSSCGKWGPLFIAVRGPLFIAVRGPFHYRGPSRCGAQAPDAQAQ